MALGPEAFEGPDRVRDGELGCTVADIGAVEDVEPDRVGGVAGGEQCGARGQRARDQIEHGAGQAAAAVDHREATAGDDVLGDQALEERRLAGAGRADDADVLAAVEHREMERRNALRVAEAGADENGIVGGDHSLNTKVSLPSSECGHFIPLGCVKAAVNGGAVVDAQGISDGYRDARRDAYLVAGARTQSLRGAGGRAG